MVFGERTLLGFRDYTNGDNYDHLRTCARRPTDRPTTNGDHHHDDNRSQVVRLCAGRPWRDSERAAYAKCPAFAQQRPAGCVRPCTVRPWLVVSDVGGKKGLLGTTNARRDGSGGGATERERDGPRRRASVRRTQGPARPHAQCPGPYRRGRCQQYLLHVLRIEPARVHVEVVGWPSGWFTRGAARRVPRVCGARRSGLVRLHRTCTAESDAQSGREAAVSAGVAAVGQPWSQQRYAWFQLPMRHAR